MTKYELKILYRQLEDAEKKLIAASKTLMDQRSAVTNDLVTESLQLTEVDTMLHDIREQMKECLSLLEAN